MTRVVGQVPVQPMTVASLPVRVYTKPSAEAARAPLGAAKLPASRRTRAAERIRLAGIRHSTLPPRDPERRAHTCTIPWREEFWGDVT